MAHSSQEAQATWALGSLTNSGVKQASGVFKVLQVTPMVLQAKCPLPGHCCSPAVTSPTHWDLQGPVCPPKSETAFQLDAWGMVCIQFGK